MLPLGGTEYRVRGISPCYFVQQHMNLQRPQNKKFNFKKSVVQRRRTTFHTAVELGKILEIQLISPHRSTNDIRKPSAVKGFGATHD